MRGTLHGPSQFGDISRFIPAGAGNTRLRPRTNGWRTVYPRWRGEHAGQTGNDCDVRRFIPAGAGNTHNDTNNIRSNPVYPRWRGEHSAIWRRIRRPCGLSPLARGTPAQVRRVRRHRRFIPAGAGNTADTPDDEIIVAVYPRWRGEHRVSKHK